MGDQSNIVEKENSVQNLLHRHLEGEEEGSVIHVAVETVYGYMGGFSIQHVTFPPGWYWNTWEDGGGPLASKEEAIEAAKGSMKSWDEYCRRAMYY